MKIPRQVLAFAIENHSELFGYIATGRINIRIHREDGLPKRSSGKQDVVWGGMRVALL